MYNQQFLLHQAADTLTCLISTPKTEPGLCSSPSVSLLTEAPTRQIIKLFPQLLFSQCHSLFILLSCSCIFFFPIDIYSSNLSCILLYANISPTSVEFSSSNLISSFLKAHRKERCFTLLYSIDSVIQTPNLPKYLLLDIFYFQCMCQIQDLLIWEHIIMLEHYRVLKSFNKKCWSFKRLDYEGAVVERFVSHINILPFMNVELNWALTCPSLDRKMLL